MLRYISNQGKTFEDRMTDALMQIPLYTDEWTDFNAADPGITILETLTGFETLQQEHILEVPESVKRRLLALVGFRAVRGRGARLLMAAETVRRPVRLAANHRFLLGDMVFETNKSVEIADMHLLGIYGRKAGEAEFVEFPQLLDHETDIPAAIFGERPGEGDRFYLVSDALPGAEQETYFYFSLKKRFNRNPPSGREENAFATLRWECWCKGGWKEIRVRDRTCSFLMSGEIRMWLPEGAAVYDQTPVKGYCIRAVLEQAQYDVRPRLAGVWAFLFEVWQKRTISECFSFGKASEIRVESGIPEELYLDVYCREAKGESYYKYEYSPQPDSRGRFYDRTDEGNGCYRLLFDREAHGFGPLRSRDCVRVVCYTGEVMRRFRIGRVLGADRQRIPLPFGRIVSGTFSIIARRERSGGYVYDFVRPEKNEEGSLYYHLLESDGAVEIEDAGDFIGAELFLGGIAVHEGENGNIRSGNRFVSVGEESGNVYRNPKEATGGAFREDTETLRKRFVADMETTYAAVTAKDYEQLVRTTPGLCIHKAKAHMDEEKNLVSIVVKPGTDERYPRLPEIYRKVILARLEERRLLATRIELVQPVYVAVNVTGTVYAKLHYEDSRSQVERVVRQQVDYLESERDFGERLHFDEVFHAIENLDCVEYVYDLSLQPQSIHGAGMEDADICPAWNALLYPGRIAIETIVFEE